MKKKVREILTKACQDLHEEDAEHFQGGCGDISCALETFLKEHVPALDVSVMAGTVYLKSVGRHTHVWLTIQGELFDPIEAGTDWGYVRYKEAGKKRRQEIIELHADVEIHGDWKNSYEHLLLNDLQTKTDWIGKLNTALNHAS